MQYWLKKSKEKNSNETKRLNSHIHIRWELKEDQNITNSRTGLLVNALNIPDSTGYTEREK